MPRLVLALTVHVEVDVPDGSPLTAERLRSAIDWKANDYSDGRHPFSTELVSDGAERIAQNGVEAALFSYYADLPLFCPPHGTTPDRLEARNALAARRTAEVRVRHLRNTPVRPVVYERCDGIWCERPKGHEGGCDPA